MREIKQSSLGITVVATALRHYTPSVMRQTPHAMTASAAVSGALLIVPLVRAVVVADSSPCAQFCGNVLSATTESDVTCDESAYTSTAAGKVYKSCVECQLNSTYVPDANAKEIPNNMSDTYSLLYNLRYAFSSCVFGYPSNAFSSPCVTSTACGPLEPALEYGNLTVSGNGTYDYCQQWIGYRVESCSNCLLAGDEHYLRNFLAVLDTGCQQQPGPGVVLSFEGDPFSDVLVNATTPTPTPPSTISTKEGPLSLGGKVGITVAAVALLLLLAAVFIICRGKRRRRAYLNQIQTHMHEGQYSFKNLAAGTGSMRSPSDAHSSRVFDTPLSQQPLRRWDESPISPYSSHMPNAQPSYADSTSDPISPHLVSPYASNFSSPVDGQVSGWPAMPAQTHVSPIQNHCPISVPAAGAWQNSMFERAIQAQNEQKQQQQQHSQQSGEASGWYNDVHHAGGDVKGKAVDEFEMRDVQSPVRDVPQAHMPAVPTAAAIASAQTTATAPILKHPGYWRPSWQVDREGKE